MKNKPKNQVSNAIFWLDYEESEFFIKINFKFINNLINLIKIIIFNILILFINY